MKFTMLNLYLVTIHLLLLYCIISTTYLLIHHYGIDMTDILHSNHPFINQRRALYSIEIEPEIAINTIVMWAGNIDEIPNNWVLCDGQNNTPNLTDKFVIGASTTQFMHSEGGNTNIQLTLDQIPKHSHDLTNESIIIEDAGQHHHYINSESINVSNHNGHQHIISTDNISVDGGHYHSVGNYYIPNNGAHIHDIKQGNIDSSSLSITSVGSHTHTYSGSTSGAGSHTHTTSLNVVGGIGSYYGVLGIGATYSGTNPTGSAGYHSHTYSGSTASSGSHSHGLQGSLLLENVSMDINGIHSHELNGESESNGTHHHELYTVSKVHGEHKHLVDGQTEYNNEHNHDIDYGWTQSVGNAENIEIINPYYALAFIMKTSYDSAESEERELVEDVYSDTDASTSSGSTVMWVLTCLILLLIAFVFLMCYLYGFKIRTSDEIVNEKDNGECEVIDTFQCESSIAKPDNQAVTAKYCESDNENSIDNISNNIQDNEISELVQMLNTSEGFNNL